MNQYFKLQEMENPQHSVHHFKVPYYHKIQEYSYPEYILGLKKLTLTMNMIYMIYIIYTQENVQMDHP